MKSESTPKQPADREILLARDLDLVRSILSGSVPAWHQFLDLYSGLIYTVIRRRLFSQDEDTIRTIYVDILEQLYRGELTKFRGGGRLSTWLIIFTRCRALDAYRKRHGRNHLPRGYDRLSAFDRKVHQLFHLDRLPLDVLMTSVEWGGRTPDLGTIIDSIERIEEALGARYLEKLDNEYQARRSGIDSARLLRNYLQLKQEYSEKASASAADAGLAEQEARQRLDELRAAVATLSSEENRLIFLRFVQGLSARDIARELSIEPPKAVYSLINKVIKKLHRLMTGAEG